jgi:hypothetical protein
MNDPNHQYEPASPNKAAHKPWYKKWWIWAIVIIIGIIATAGGGDNDNAGSTSSTTPSATTTTTIDAEAEASASAAAAAEEAARLDPTTYTAISTRDWQLIEKDPDSHYGEKYVIYGYVTQADASTGTEGFRANTGGEQTDWYNYDINTIVIADSDIVANVVTDDIVQMYVEVLGSYTYETQIGGETTAVSVQANILNALGTSND